MTDARWRWWAGLLVWLVATGCGDDQPDTLSLVADSVRDSIFAVEHTWLASAASDDAIPSRTRVWRMFSVSGSYQGALRLPEGFGYPYASCGGMRVVPQNDGVGGDGRLSCLRGARAAWPDQRCAHPCP